MTRPIGSSRAPGTMLLKIAPLLFNHAFISDVVRPTIADLRSEVAAAGPHGVKRLRARWRGYWAFWTLIFVAPFTSSADDVPNAAVGRVAVVPVTAMLFTVVTFGAWMAVVAAAAALVAFLLHAWYERHPCEVATPPDAVWRSPQINFSSTEVAGNVGGLIFVVGSLLIVSVGVPSIFWFLCAGTIAACPLAWALVAWHARGADWTCAGRPPKQLF